MYNFFSKPVVGIAVFLIFFLTTTAVVFLISFSDSDYPKEDLEKTVLVPVELELIEPVPYEENEESKELEEKEKEKGKNQAEIDVKNGKFIVYQNREAGSSLEYRNIMLKKYGVKIVEGGDAVSLEQTAYNSGYNSISIPAIEKKYGQGIIEKIEKEMKNSNSKKRDAGVI